MSRREGKRYRTVASPRVNACDCHPRATPAAIHEVTARLLTAHIAPSDSLAHLVIRAPAKKHVAYQDLPHDMYVAENALRVGV
jgi:hypothetical protein